MKTYQLSLNFRRLLWNAGLICLTATGTAKARSDTDALSAQPPAGPVSRSDSKLVAGAKVYSIRYPGGTASGFFNFLRTNGFASDEVLFAGRAGDVHIPDFTVKNVRLRDVAKAIELVTEDRLIVDLQQSGELSDVNVWRIKVTDAASHIKTKSCAMPKFLRIEANRRRISEIAEKVAQTLSVMIDSGHNRGPAATGTIQTLESEKIVVVLGSEAYVEAVAGALEAAEKAAP
jgi:hypothetical protein